MNALPVDPIEAMRPWGTPTEKALRRRLHKSWHLSAAGAARAQSGAARTILWIIAQAASDWTFAVHSEEEMKDMADTLVRLFVCANAFERLERPENG